MNNEYERLIRNELDYWPGVTVTFSHGSKHRKATFHFNGQSRFVIYPDTPGDTVRGPRNNIVEVRRELINLGAERLPRKPSKRKRAGKVIGSRKPTKPRVPKPTPPEPPAESWRTGRRKQGIAEALASLQAEPLDLGQYPQPTEWENFSDWIARNPATAAVLFVTLGFGLLILMDIVT